MLLSFITGASLFLTGFLWARLDLSFLMIPVMVVGFWLAMLLAAFLILWIACAVVDVKKPQEHDSPFYRKLMDLTVEALVSLVQVRIKATGLEHTPKEGRFLLVCNHQSIADPGVLLYCFRRSQLAFISKKENETMFIVGKIMHKTMSQLINRENDREALKTILKCIQLIKDDEVSIGAFPEGGIFELNKLAHFRSGVFKVAQKAGVPIVVCTMKNTADILPNLTKLKPTHVELNLLGVIPAEELQGRTAVDIGEQVYEMMIADLGESFRPVNAE